MSQEIHGCGGVYRYGGDGGVDDRTIARLEERFTVAPFRRRVFSYADRPPCRSLLFLRVSDHQFVGYHRAGAA